MVTMDPLSVLMNVEENETEDAPENKKDRKRKMSVSMVKKIQAKMAEEMRQQIIKQKQEYLRETKKRVQEEWEYNHAKALVYEEEFATRLQQLNISCQRLSEVEDAWREFLKEKRIRNEWELYLDCGRLPNPTSISQLNSYIFVWTEIEHYDQMSYCIKKTEEVMKLLSSLEEVISNPGPECPSSFLRDMKELRREIRRLLQDNIDRATFNLFSKIETDMVPINVTTSKYFAKCPNFLMSLWAELITPIPASKAKEVRNPMKVTFEETDIVVVLPVALLYVQKVMRAMWLTFDHWTDKCRTYDCPEAPEYYKQNLRELVMSEFDAKADIMNYREKLEVTMKKKIAMIPAEPTLSQEIFAWDAEPQKALSDEIIYRECEEEDNMGRQIMAILNEFEVNLRERTILGDLLFLEAFHLPPQPKYLRYKHSVTLRKGPPKLQQVDYYVLYPPPVLPEDEEEEEAAAAEEEPEGRSRKKTSRFNIQKEDPMEDLKKLVLIQLKPCQSVVWFEEPQPANWDPIREYWSTEDVHEVTHDEDDGTITFRTGRLGLMGLHVHRYLNFPYLDWVFEAGSPSEIDFFLKTPRAEFNFKIREGEVCLESMKDVPSKSMNWILGLYFPPVKLMQTMKKGGIDVFPAPDAACYISDVQSKHLVIESNIYQVWGLFFQSFRFRRSKFNQSAKRSDIVFQAQEIYKNHQVDYCLIQTAVCSSYVLDINEESETYSPEPAPYMKSHVDLYSLLYHNATMKARRQSDVTSFLLVQTVKEFFTLVRPLSFS